MEEPQAAFYDYLHRQRDTLHQDLAQTRRILVCDVGGGTTDFSLIDVALMTMASRSSRASASATI